MKKKILILTLLWGILSIINIQAQDNPPTDDTHTYKPLKLKLNDDGSKYLRFIMWHQLWMTSNNLSNDSKAQANFSIRRSRLLAYAQISPKFLILTHFGLNSLNASNMTSLGNNGDTPQLFLHGAWGELKVNDELYIGAGLHYWRGLTRLNNQSTLNFMTLDQHRPFYAWHSLGVTDQFARHVGVYAKGSIGKFEYRFAANNPIRATLGEGRDFSASFNVDGIPRSSLTYNGVSIQNADNDPVGNMVYEGYVKYNLFDNESTKLPYYVGTYMGKKKVFAIGAGFYAHPSGMYNNETNEHEGVSHFAVDAFLDMPTSTGAVNAYAAFTNYNYGENYISRWGGTGNSIYAQAGYFIKSAKIMPYVGVSNASFDGADDNITGMDIGVNYFINGHHCKITAEYHLISKDYREGAIVPGVQDDFSQIRVQLHVFL